ncbi:hypothetical protein BD626DRAFT_484357 [Schizophyllum amplum]|uniref:Secreted protein n=1 Tax=Schizophyllum amplum TaxID=97359 RepID=A0A550CQ93_9AGAR|nr:hypothetical protein BD626DRAFT_484357 [Auriculariopsis ampla]
MGKKSYIFLATIQVSALALARCRTVGRFWLPKATWSITCIGTGSLGRCVRRDHARPPRPVRVGYREWVSES